MKRLYLLILILFSYIPINAMNYGEQPDRHEVLALIERNDHHGLSELCKRNNRAFTDMYGSSEERTPLLALPELTVKTTHALLEGGAQIFAWDQNGVSSLEAVINRIKTRNEAEDKKILAILAQEFAKTAAGQDLVKKTKKYVMTTFEDPETKSEVLHLLNDVVPARSGGGKRKKIKGGTVSLQEFWRSVVKKEKQIEEKQLEGIKLKAASREQYEKVVAQIPSVVAKKQELQKLQALQQERKRIFEALEAFKKELIELNTRIALYYEKKEIRQAIQFKEAVLKELGQKTLKQKMLQELNLIHKEKQARKNLLEEGMEKWKNRKIERTEALLSAFIAQHLERIKDKEWVILHGNQSESEDESEKDEWEEVESDEIEITTM